MPRENIFKLKTIPLLLSFTLFQFVLLQQATAACDTSTPGTGVTTNCSGVNGAAVTAQAGSTNVTINAQAGGSFSMANPGGSAFSILSVEDSSQINNYGSLTITGGAGTPRGAAMLGVNDSNVLHNYSSGTIITSGDHNDGMVADGTGNMLINEGNIKTNGSTSYGMTAGWGQANKGQKNNQFINKGTITTTGTSSRGISVIGGSGEVWNEGTVLTTGSNSAAVFVQGDKGRVINKGLIEAQGTGAQSEGIFSNTAGGAFTAYIENQLGGQIISHNSNGIRTLNGSTTVVNAGLIRGAVDAIHMGTGNNTLILQTGSVIDGNADGGAGSSDNVYLEGTGFATNPFNNFEHLTMRGNQWTWTGTGAFDTVNINTGEFQLMSTLTGTQSTVAAGAKLSGTGVLTGNLTNQGTVQAGIGNTNGALTIQGNYQGAAGSIVQVYTALGNDASATSRLILDGGVAGGTSGIRVVNVGGTGAQTVGNGIMVIQAINGATIAPTTFTLSERVVAGAYDYLLYQGTPTNSNDQSWYLRNVILPVGSTDPSTGKPVYRPEIGSYLNNQSTSATMFMHTLHDRLGEPQYTAAYREDGSKPSAWARVVTNNTKSKSMYQTIKVDTDSTLIHLGGELAQWSSNGSNRWHLGLMGAYGHNSAEAKADLTGYKAKAKVNGYSVGAYGTWYQNDTERTGLYVDTWAQYGWYRNEVQGDTLAKEKYDSDGLLVSVEAGYAFALNQSGGRQWLLEPQAQLAYNGYKAKDHREANGTLIDNSNADSVITRLGGRLYSRQTQSSNSIQPFVEANWWHNTAKNTLDFNGQTVTDDTPKDRYELKLGVAGEIAKNWQLWGHIGGQWGDNHYSRYEGMLGVKRLF